MGVVNVSYMAAVRTSALTTIAVVSLLTVVLSSMMILSCLCGQCERVVVAVSTYSRMMLSVELSSRLHTSDSPKPVPSLILPTVISRRTIALLPPPHQALHHTIPDNSIFLRPPPSVPHLILFSHVLCCSPLYPTSSPSRSWPRRSEPCKDSCPSLLSRVWCSRLGVAET